MHLRFQTIEYGDSSLMVVPDADHPAIAGNVEKTWTIVQNLTSWLLESGLPGVVDAIPTYDRVLVELDPARTDHQTVAAFISVWGSLIGDRSLEAVPPRHTYRVPVLYGGDAGPDLEIAADYLGLPADELVRAHVSLVHPIRVLAQGGGPMLYGLASRREVPRRKDPRVKVPAGAVMLAGRQALILPVESPSGWRIIGRTPVRVVDPESEDLVDHRPGDLLTYYQIAESDWDSLTALTLRDCRV